MLALVNTPNGNAPAEIHEVDNPSAEPDEAVVQIHAFSLNRGELALLANRPAGWRPGQDIAGMVVQEAADGSGPRVGERVTALVDQAGWAQRVATPTSRLAVLPDTVDLSTAAALPMVGITAMRALRVGGSLLGRRVLVTGASGGVGHIAIQLAACSGAQVTGIASRPERVTGVRKFDAIEIVPTIDELELSGSFDLILESVGGASLEAAMRCVAPGGTIVIFGNSSGQNANVSFSDFGRLYPDGAQIRFFFHSSGTETFGADLERLVSLVASGDLAPRIGMEESWQGLSRIAEALRERRFTGKAVAHVDQ